MFTMHGIVMVFFFLIPSIPATLGNSLAPLMIGARDLAFPKINLLSWYLFSIGGLFMLGCIIGGGADTGWTFCTPYSSVFARTNVVLAVVAIFIAGSSSILTGLNLVVTIHKLRAPGMGWLRLPLFLWSLCATSIIQLLGTELMFFGGLFIAFTAYRIRYRDAFVHGGKHLKMELGRSTPRCCSPARLPSP